MRPRRVRSAPGCSAELPGRSRERPGHVRDAPRAPRDAPGKHQGRPGMIQKRAWELLGYLFWTFASENRWQDLSERRSINFGLLEDGPDVDLYRPCQCFVKIKPFLLERPPEHETAQKSGNPTRNRFTTCLSGPGSPPSEPSRAKCCDVL